MIPQQIKELAAYLQNHESKLMAVGGYVRDEFYDKPSCDIDLVAFGCTFDFLRQACQRVGLPVKQANEQNYPVLACQIDETVIEITIPRTLENSNSIVASPYATVEQDAMRRDFTANAIYKDVLTGIIVDPLNGVQHIQNGQLVMCNPNTFNEDPRRTLRVPQMISRFGVEIDRELLIKARMADLSHIANEVLGTTLKKILMGKDVVSAFDFLVKSNAIHLFKYLPETINFDQLHPRHNESLFQHLVLAAELGTEYGLEFALAGLYHDISKTETQVIVDGQASYHGHEVKSIEMIEDVLISYGFGKNIVQRTLELIRYHMNLCTSDEDITEKSIKRLQHKLQFVTLEELLKFGKVDQLARVPIGDMKVLERINTLLNASPEVADKFKPILMGKHLIKVFNMKPGPEIGTLLKKAEIAQTDGEFSNLSQALMWAGKELGIQPKRIRVDLPVTHYDIYDFCERHNFDTGRENIDKIAGEIRNEMISLAMGWLE